MGEKTSCPYCGNNPVPHFFTWYYESLNVFMTPLRRVFIFNPLANWLRGAAGNLNLGWRFANILTALGVLSVQEDAGKCKVSRAQVLWEEAGRRGIEMAELKIFGKPFDTYIAAKKEFPISNFQFPNKPQVPNIKPKTIIFSGLPRPKNSYGLALDVLDDKVILKKKFSRAGLPVPQGGSATSFRQAKKIFEQIQKPHSRTNFQSSIPALPAGRLNLKSIIVKPRAGSRGRHTTTFVSTEADLKKAFKVAKQLCHWVVVEEQLFGPVYRATVIDYKIRGVLRGDPPQVAGDGFHNIAQLIETKNLQPQAGVKNIIVSDETKIFLSRQNLNVETVPKINQIINLSEKIGVNYGGCSSEDFEICHPDNKELFERAAKTAGDPIVGFDFIIPDITKSYKQQKCGFIEANSLPFINLHHDPLHGNPRNVAQYVWELVGL